MNASNSKIFLNHVGFKKNVRKSIYTVENLSDSFQVEKMIDCKFEEIFRGKLSKVQAVGGEMYSGDFTDVTDPGIYRIRVGNFNSRIFTIDEKLHDSIQRTLFNFVTQQSCGTNVGWAGACHTGDQVKLANGEVRDLSGGFHQSSDLRKWSWGISLGMIGLLEYALLAKPLWNSGEIEREIRNGCDYYLKLISDEGYIIDSCFIPVDDNGLELPRSDENHLMIHGKGYSDQSISWNSREFYDRPTASPAHWFTIRFLSLASRYFRDRDKSYSDKCLANATKIWKFMEKHAERTYNYDLPMYPPLGHDPLPKWWVPFYENSTLEIAGRAAAGIELKLALGTPDFDTRITEDINALCRMQITGTNSIADGAFWEGKDSRLANNFHYFFSTNVPTALCKAIQTMPNNEFLSNWKNCLALVCNQYLQTNELNGFRRAHGTMFTEDAFQSGACFSFSEELLNDNPEAYFAGNVAQDKIYFKYFSFCYNLDLAAVGIVLKHASKIFNTLKYEHAAQNQIDWLLGGNPFDASSIEGIGYNNPHRGVFGEFFPPVPQIPGGVYTGITAHSFTEEAYGLECEYDLPETTWLMHLLQL